MLGIRREDVEDAPAHRELAAAGHEVDPGVGESGELEGERGEVVAATPGRERHALEVGESRHDGLQRGPHGRDDDEVTLSVPRPVLDRSKGAQPAADRLGARAQALVRQGLPGREVEHRRGRQVGAHRPDDGIHLATRRGDREERLGRAPGVEKRREHGHPQPVDEGEVGILLAKPQRGLERAGVRQPRNHRVQTHSFELRALPRRALPPRPCAELRPAGRAAPQPAKSGPPT